MQTLQFTRALRLIVQELRVAEIIELLKPFMAVGNNLPIPQETRDQFAGLLFDSRTRFTRLAEDPVNLRILSSLGVEQIYDPTRLGRLLSLFNQLGSGNNIWGTPNNFVQFYTLYTQLLVLTDVAKTCTELLEQEKLGQATNADSILELQLIDYEGAGVEEARLAQFVSSLRKLHSAFAKLLNVSEDQLRFLYFDSGSDFIAAINCAPAIITSIKVLLGEWWEKIKFGRYEEFGKKMDAFAKSLSVMETVQQAVSNKVIDQETGDLLKTQVLVEVDRLVGIGATLPFSHRYQPVDERKLLLEKRDVKLLVSGSPDEPTKGTMGNV